jgi:hypothetical protein
MNYMLTYKLQCTENMQEWERMLQVLLKNNFRVNDVRVRTGEQTDGQTEIPDYLATYVRLRVQTRVYR